MTQVVECSTVGLLAPAGRRGNARKKSTRSRALSPPLVFSNSSARCWSTASTWRVRSARSVSSLSSPARTRLAMLRTASASKSAAGRAPGRPSRASSCASTMSSSTPKMAREALGMYCVISRLRLRAFLYACARAILCLSCWPQCCSALVTAAEISAISSLMYSLLVPLKGILVLTMLTKTPTLSALGSILYCAHLRRSAQRLHTSLPGSKSSGMRLAKRYTVSPCFRSLPPMLTAASTTKGWPSYASASTRAVAHSSGANSL
mmetsp:Transcript_19626/g.60963  ORF Transcript_19626/g.60963 Transcript_19626/m.60963 type:complete len:263 (+) Transcript_19626:225-1013(+)